MSLAILFMLLAASSLNVVSALPTELQRRTPGDEFDPYDFQLDCTGKEQVCNVDCETILCFQAPQKVQFDPEHASEHRRQSYNNLRLASMSQSDREARGIFIPDAVLAAGILSGRGLSIEESVMANTAQGGVGDILYYVDATQNSGQSITNIAYNSERLT